MNLETILDVLVDSHYQLIHHWNEHGHNKRYRQRDAFRARILRMDAEKDKLIEQYQIYHGYYMGDVEMIETIAEKDAKLEGHIAELDIAQRRYKKLKKSYRELDRECEHFRDKVVGGRK